MVNERTGIGGNNPPAFDAFSMELDDIYSTAKDFLDGAEVTTQGEADAIGTVMAAAKKVKKDADTARTEEKAPHLEAGKAVDARWKPMAERCDTIIAAARNALTPYLARLEAEHREAARIARVEADRAAQEAIEAQRAAQGSLDAIEAARGLQDQADDAAKAAARADKAKAHVVGADRAIGLRTSWTHRITDRRELLNWVAKNDAPALEAMLDEYARRAVAGGTRWLPGVAIEQTMAVA